MCLFLWMSSSLSFIERCTRSNPALPEETWPSVRLFPFSNPEQTTRTSIGFIFLTTSFTLFDLILTWWLISAAAMWTKIIQNIKHPKQNIFQTTSEYQINPTLSQQEMSIQEQEMHTSWMVFNKPATFELNTGETMMVSVFHNVLVMEPV